MIKALTKNEVRNLSKILCLFVLLIFKNPVT